MTRPIDIDEAQARLLAGVVALASEDVALVDARGRVLAADVVARRDQPPFAASAMDGYAIRHRDLPGPWRVVGESAAGARYAQRLEPGEAVRILTGAPMPIHSDSVVIQEDTRLDGDMLFLTADGPEYGQNVRRAGLDFEADTLLVRTGDRVTPARIGVAAAGGHARLSVHRRPRVVLLAIGDELVPPGTSPGPDAIVNANGVMLAALLGGLANVVDGGIVPDMAAALATALRSYTDGPDAVDVVMTIGGASVGDHDHVVPVLRAIGAEIDFWKIALRPGKPMLSARRGATRIVGLPGNPVSAFVCTALLVMPLLRALAGDRAPLPRHFLASAGAPFAANGARTDYLRARLDDGGDVVAAQVQDSSMLSVLANSNVLVRREPHAPTIALGTMVSCIALDTIFCVS